MHRNDLKKNKKPRPEKKPASLLPPHGLAFVLVATAFSSYAFVPSALSAQLLAIFERFGLAPATVVAIGMLFGPAQVLARICELTFARHLHPLWIARFSVGLSGGGVRAADAVAVFRAVGRLLSR